MTGIERRGNVVVKAMERLNIKFCAGCNLRSSVGESLYCESCETGRQRDIKIIERRELDNKILAFRWSYVVVILIVVLMIYCGDRSKKTTHNKSDISYYESNAHQQSNHRSADHEADHS